MSRVSTVGSNEVFDAWRRQQEGMQRLWAHAQGDPVLFNALVLRDEKTGARVHTVPMHEAWHDLVTTSDRTVIWAHVEAGKTQQLSIGRTLYELGRDHNLRCAIVSNTADQAAKLVRLLAKYIKTSEECKGITGLRAGDPWTSTRLYVEREVASKDPSIQGLGIGGNVLGSRIDWLVLDDVLDYENCRTPEQRKKLIEWYMASLAGRLTAKARVCVVGTAFFPDDLLHALAKSQGWTAVRYPVIDEMTGQSNWPERWPADRIEKAKASDMTPAEFARQLLCKARSDEDARFKWEWIRRGLERGAGRSMARGLQRVPAGCKVVTGVDLAVQQHSAADKTVLFTIIIHPDGSREVLEIQSGRWAGPDIVARIVDAHNRYQSIIIVENNAAQDYILQFTRGASAVPVRGFTTGRNKSHPEFGIESIAAEMSNGKWLIPNAGPPTYRCHPEVSAWMDEMLYYDPAAHTGDRLMACWFAREGVRMAAIRAESGPLNLHAR